ncbi:MAG: succinate--CoA ligase subunit alpha [Actinobacteria bacterium]|nr:succinate--CoA ligase subunit alpha [Actinomycetota bacterium]
MSVLLDASARVLVQGMTGEQGAFHAQRMRAAGTQVVAGVTPGRAGVRVPGLEDVPVVNTVADAVRVHGANTAAIFVPAPFAADAILEDVSAGIRLIVCITEGVPALDMVRVLPRVRRSAARLVGPNCPGVISPAQRAKVGIMPWEIHRPGPVGVVSRSGTLTYEVVQHLSDLGLGQSTAVGIGGDPIVGTSFVDVLELFEGDPETQAVALLGEIGGDAEEQAAAFVRSRVTKPVVAFVAGKTAPPERRMGHAGAIISGGAGGAAGKIAALRAAGVVVAETPAEAARLIAARLG